MRRGKAFALAVVTTCALLTGAGAVWASSTMSLQSGDYADHVMVEEYANGGNNIGPGWVGMSVACPENYYATGGGYEFNYATSPTVGYRGWFNGPASGWGALGTAWSASGYTDTAGLMRVWAFCLKLT